MSSYVIVELDTTAPHIDIYAPRYTTRDVVNIITIESNETLADYQEIYIVDSNEVRHDLTFNRESDTRYVGAVRFNNISIGIVQIFARMKDEVDNFSNSVIKTIEVKNSLKSAVARVKDISLYTVNIKDAESHRTIVSDITMKENLNEEDQWKYLH